MNNPDRRKEDLLQKLIVKQAIKEAIKEWLTDVFYRFGKWSLAALAAWALIGFINLIIVLHKNPFDHIIAQALDNKPPL